MLIGWKRSLLSVSLGLWCLIAIIPFASHTHYLPLPQWWGEMEAVWLTLASVCLAISVGYHRLTLPRASIWCGVLGVLWVIQPFFVSISFPGLNEVTAMAWGVLALLALGTTVLRKEFDTPMLTVWLARALMVGALVQSIIGFIQLSGLAPLTHGIIFYDRTHPTTNIFGHIGQRNQFAHYLMWGMVAAIYLYAVGRLRRWVLVIWAVWLALLLAFSGSRMILLYELGIIAVSGVWHWRIRSPLSWTLLKAAFFSCVIISVMQLLFPFINQILLSITHSGGAVVSGIERLITNSDNMSSRRFAEMHKAWLVFQEHPWWGVGWSQFATYSVKLQALPLFAHAGVNSGLFLNAHNLVVQLLSEMGGMITLTVLLGFIWVVAPFFTTRAMPEGFLPLACLSITLFHSMLEYPLWYFYFLSMAVIFVSLAPHRGYRMRMGFRVLTVMVMLVLIIEAFLAFPYHSTLEALYGPTDDRASNRKREERLINIINTNPRYAFHALFTLDDYLEASPERRADTRYWVNRLAAVRPYPSVLLKKAQLEALAHEPTKALETMKEALASFPTYAQFFRYELAQGPAEWQPLDALCKQSLAKNTPKSIQTIEDE